MIGTFLRASSPVKRHPDVLMTMQKRRNVLNENVCWTFIGELSVKAWEGLNRGVLVLGFRGLMSGGEGCNQNACQRGSGFGLCLN